MSGMSRLGWIGGLSVSLYINCMLCGFCNLILWKSASLFCGPLGTVLYRSAGVQHLNSPHFVSLQCLALENYPPQGICP